MIRSSRFAAALAASLVVSGSAFAKGVSKTPDAVPGQLIVKLRSSGLSTFSVDQAQKRIRQILGGTLGIQSVAGIDALQMDEQIQVVKLASAKTEGALATLKMSPEVQYAEPNFIYRTQLSGVDGAPNDTDFDKQWDLVNTGQADKSGQLGTTGSDVNVLPVWNRGIVGNRNVLVAVIDTGVDYNHPDLKANIYTNAGEVAGNGVDDDGNGIVDDVHGAGFENGVGSNKSMDDNNHGSHCSGTIGAAGNDANGITGVNWEVSILPVKFLSASGSGSLEDALNAVKYATKMGANVMSNSWGGGGYSQALADAVRDAIQSGTLFVAAAGNSAMDNDASPSYPANYPGVLSVAATDNRDVIANFSNYGKTTVQVAAPGHRIYSTIAGGGYDTYSGTSMACPHVAGAAALIMAADSSLTAEQVKQRLIATSTPVKGLSKKVASKGRINIANAVDNVIPQPLPEPDETQWVDQAFTAESAHPYASNANQTFEVSAPGAKYIRVVFEKVEVESGYDFVKIENGAGEAADTVSGTKLDYVSEYVEGERAVIRLTSDYSENKYGFKVSKIQVIR